MIMKLCKKLLLGFILWILVFSNLNTVNVVLAQGPSEVGLISSDNIHKIMDMSVRGVWSSKHLKLSTKEPGTNGAEGFNVVVLDLIDYIIDIFIMIGVIVAFIGAYQIMTSNKEDASKKWINYVVYGVIWIIVMVSAKFIAWTMINVNENYLEEQLKWVEFAKAIYNDLMYPFIKIALYLIVGILFFFMVSKVITFIFSTDDKAKKKAWWIILRTVIWIFVIMGAKQVVEGVMGRQEDIFKMTEVEYSQRWKWILEFESIPIATQIINWIMGLAMLAVLILIIIQAYRMVVKPDDPKNRERLKKSLIYIIIGVWVIMATSIIANILLPKA